MQTESAREGMIDDLIGSEECHKVNDRTCLWIQTRKRSSYMYLRYAEFMRNRYLVCTDPSEQTHCRIA